MSDTYREILVKRKTPAGQKVLKGAFPVLAVLFFVAGLMLWPFWIAAAVFAVLAFLVGPRMEVEYEYLYVNGELDIDAIYSRQKRKKIGSYDMEELEILAPARSHALDSYLNRQGTKVKDFTSGTAPEKSYILVINHEKEQQIIKVELDDAIIADIRRLAPRKVSMV